MQLNQQLRLRRRPSSTYQHKDVIEMRALIAIIFALFGAFFLLNAEASYQSESGPTLARHGEEIFIAFRSGDGSDIIRVAKISVTETNRIEPDQSRKTNSRTRDPVALASHNGGLWMAFVGADPGRNIYLKRIDRDLTTRATKLPFKSSTSPALVSYGGKMFMFWRRPARQPGQSREIRWASFDGRNWSAAATVNAVTDGKFAPAAAVSGNRIHLVFAGLDGRLNHLKFNGSSWSHGQPPTGPTGRTKTLKSPRMVDVNGILVLSTVDNNAQRGADNKVMLYKSDADGYWTPGLTFENTDLRPDIVGHGNSVLLAVTTDRSVPLLQGYDSIYFSLHSVGALGQYRGILPHAANVTARLTSRNAVDLKWSGSRPSSNGGVEIQIAPFNRSMNWASDPVRFSGTAVEPKGAGRVGVSVSNLPGGFGPVCFRVRYFLSDRSSGYSDAVCTGMRTVIPPSPPAPGSAAGNSGGPSWQISLSAKKALQNWNATAKPLSKAIVGDFDGDGKTDSLIIESKTRRSAEVFFSKSASSVWASRLKFSGNSRMRMLVGDFDGDGADDLFRSSGDAWYVSNGGQGAWRRINSSSAAIEKLAVGDFNGDGKADIFAANGATWKVSYGGTSRWSQINSSKVTTPDLAFGDFNGDGKTDVFRSTGKIWLVSYGGSGKWAQLNASGVSPGNLRIADVNGDGKSDVVRFGGSVLRVSYGGASKWTTLVENIPDGPVVFGDFNGDGKDDALVTR